MIVPVHRGVYAPVAYGLLFVALLGTVWAALWMATIGGPWSGALCLGIGLSAIALPAMLLLYAGMGADTVWVRLPDGSEVTP